MELIKLNAVVGVVGTVRGTQLKSVGITCALCHSTVDNAVTTGVGNRLDGWPNRDLNPGAIIALSPALTSAQKAVYNSWETVRVPSALQRRWYQRPVLIPPAYGLKGVGFETYTGDGPISVSEQLRCCLSKWVDMVIFEINKQSASTSHRT